VAAKTLNIFLSARRVILFLLALTNASPCRLVTVSMSICLPVYLSVCLSVCLWVCGCVSMSLSVFSCVSLSRDTVQCHYLLLCVYKPTIFYTVSVSL